MTGVQTCALPIFSILNVVTHPYLWAAITCLGIGYGWYDSAQKEKNRQKDIEEEILTVFDVDRNRIISREEVRLEYPALSMKYGAEDLTRVFHLNKEKFEDYERREIK